MPQNLGFSLSDLRDPSLVAKVEGGHLTGNSVEDVDHGPVLAAPRGLPQLGGNLFGVGMCSICKLFQGVCGLSEVIVVVGEVKLGSNHCNIQLIVNPTFSQPGVEHRSIKPGIAANEESKVSILNTSNGGVEKVVGS